MIVKNDNWFKRKSFFYLSQGLYFEFKLVFLTGMHEHFKNQFACFNQDLSKLFKATASLCL